jgi:hypothetical protein
MGAQNAPTTAGAASAGEAAPAVTTPAAATVPQASAPQQQGGTIRGTVIAGTVGKPGGVPLPGVAVTATNTLTGKRYAAATAIDGSYAMTIPHNGRYVVRVELAGFAPVTQEVVLNGSDATAGAALVKTSNFGLELASRAAAAEARQAAASGAAQGQGVQNLSLGTGETDVTDASAGGNGGDVAMPSLGNLNDTSGGEAANSGTDSIAVNGQTGQTNGLADYSEDEIRQHVEDAVAQARASGQLPPGSDPTNAIVNTLGGMMMDGGRGGGGGGGRGFHGGGGGSGGRFGGSGAFRNFNPAQPHGSLYYVGDNSALNSAPWQPTLLPQPNPPAYQNDYGLTIGGSPYIPGLIKPNTKQFGFLNISGHKDLTQFVESARVPTLLERAGDFSQSVIGSSSTGVTLYDPKTGQPIPGNNLANATLPISPQAEALLGYYPAPNIPLNSEGDNYSTVSNGGNNNVSMNARYIRTLGQGASSPFGRFGGGGGHGRGGNSNQPPSLRQNINLNYHYSHAAADKRNIFLALGGATESGGNALGVGYTIGYGRFSNNASVNWNRLNAETRNYFTNTSNDPSTTVGLNVPNASGGFADPRFYNGLPTMSILNFEPLSNTSPSETINQTISVSDSVSWRHGKHNMRLGFDVRRAHEDSIGGNNPLGTLTFTGYATEGPAAQANPETAGKDSGTAVNGDAFADFLLGLPQTTSIQADLYKTYLRENVYDWYAQDDWRAASNMTIFYGVRYEYFGPYSEKNGRLVNLDHNAGFTDFDRVTAGGAGTYEGKFPTSLVNPDHMMYAPRLGIAYRLKNSGLTKDTVLRAGYGVNYNTGQYAVFARKLSGQAPFAVTQTNTLGTGCSTTTTTTTANMTLANGFGCSSAQETIENNWAVDKNYRLGMVQIYNVNLQRTFPLGIVFNVGYNGSKGSNLDVVGSPNGVPTAISPTGVTTPGVAPFDYEESAAGSHSNSLIVSAQKRMSRGIAVGATYTYLHSIDNASGVGGAVGTPVQTLFDLAAEEGNSSFDQRHHLTGNWVAELPFGPNRAFLNKGGFWGDALDGFSLSGTFTFATGTYYTPQFSSSTEEALAGGTYTQRPDRVFTQPIKGPGTYQEWFNTKAFQTPSGYGTASPGSIEAPGTVAVSASLSRTLQLGETRSFEARVTATNVFNTVQYSGISTIEGSGNIFGQVTSAAAMRALSVRARYRF